ncbi:MAG: hypothetical protein WCO55_02260 [Candidatus Falkowbacteria bacterium]
MSKIPMLNAGGLKLIVLFFGVILALSAQAAGAVSCAPMVGTAGACVGGSATPNPASWNNTTRRYEWQCVGGGQTVPCYQTACGNGQIDLGEQCDGFNLGGKTCLSLGFLGGGALHCNACALDTSGCAAGQTTPPSTVTPPATGTGSLCGTTAQKCTGFSPGLMTCIGLGYTGGNLACDAATCNYKTTNCVSGGATRPSVPPVVVTPPTVPGTESNCLTPPANCDVAKIIFDTNPASLCQGGVAINFNYIGGLCSGSCMYECPNSSRGVPDSCFASDKFSCSGLDANNKYIGAQDQTVSVVPNYFLCFKNGKDAGQCAGKVTLNPVTFRYEWKCDSLPTNCFACAPSQCNYDKPAPAMSADLITNSTTAEGAKAFCKTGKLTGLRIVYTDPSDGLEHDILPMTDYFTNLNPKWRNSRMSWRCVVEPECTYPLVKKNDCFHYLPFCGDSVLQEGEECDLGAKNSDTGTCNTQCKLTYCGDKRVQKPNGKGGMEQCDPPGNGTETDSNCQPVFNEAPDGKTPTPPSKTDETIPVVLCEKNNGGPSTSAKGVKANKDTKDNVIVEPQWWGKCNGTCQCQPVDLTGKGECIKGYCGATAASQADCAAGETFNADICSCVGCNADSDCNRLVKPGFPSEKCDGVWYIQTKAKCENHKCVDVKTDCSKDNLNDCDDTSHKRLNRLCACGAVTKGGGGEALTYQGLDCVCNTTKKCDKTCGSECNEGEVVSSVRYDGVNSATCPSYLDKKECQGDCTFKVIDGGTCGDGKTDTWEDKKTGAKGGEECDPGRFCSDGKTACNDPITGKADDTKCLGMKNGDTACIKRPVDGCNAYCMLDCGRGDTEFNPDSKNYRLHDYYENGKLKDGWTTLALRAYNDGDKSFFCGIDTNKYLTPVNITIRYKSKPEDTEIQTIVTTWEDMQQYLGFHIIDITWHCYEGDRMPDCHYKECSVVFPGCATGVNNSFAYMNYSNSYYDWSDFEKKYDSVCTLDPKFVQKTEADCTNLCNNKNLSAHVVYDEVNNQWTWSCGDEQCKVYQMGCGYEHAKVTDVHDDPLNLNWTDKSSAPANAAFYYNMSPSQGQGCINGGKPVMYQQPIGNEDPGFYGYNGLADSYNNRGKWLWRCEYTDPNGTKNTAPRNSGLQTHQFDSFSYNTAPTTRQDNERWCATPERGECLTKNLTWDTMTDSPNVSGNGLWENSDTPLSLTAFQAKVEAGNHFGNKSLCLNGVARQVVLKGNDENIFQLYRDNPSTITVDPAKNMGVWLDPKDQSGLWDHTGYAYYSPTKAAAYWVCDRMFDNSGNYSGSDSDFYGPYNICYAKISGCRKPPSGKIDYSIKLVDPFTKQPLGFDNLFGKCFNSKGQFEDTAAHDCYKLFCEDGLLAKDLTDFKYTTGANGVVWDWKCGGEVCQAKSSCKAVTKLVLGDIISVPVAPASTCTGNKVKYSVVNSGDCKDVTYTWMWNQSPGRTEGLLGALSTAAGSEVIVDADLQADKRQITVIATCNDECADMASDEAKKNLDVLKVLKPTANGTLIPTDKAICTAQQGTLTAEIKDCENPEITWYHMRVWPNPDTDQSGTINYPDWSTYKFVNGTETAELLAGLHDRTLTISETDDGEWYYKATVKCLDCINDLNPKYEIDMTGGNVPQTGSDVSNIFHVKINPVYALAPKLYASKDVDPTAAEQKTAMTVCKDETASPIITAAETKCTGTKTYTFLQEKGVYLPIITESANNWFNAYNKLVKGQNKFKAQVKCSDVCTALPNPKDTNEVTITYKEPAVAIDALPKTVCVGDDLDLHFTGYNAADLSDVSMTDCSNLDWKWRFRKQEAEPGADEWSDTDNIKGADSQIIKQTKINGKDVYAKDSGTFADYWFQTAWQCKDCITPKWQAANTAMVRVYNPKATIESITKDICSKDKVALAITTPGCPAGADTKGVVWSRQWQYQPDEMSGCSDPEDTDRDCWLPDDASITPSSITESSAAGTYTDNPETVADRDTTYRYKFSYTCSACSPERSLISSNWVTVKVKPESTPTVTLTSSKDEKAGDSVIQVCQDDLDKSTLTYAYGINKLSDCYANTKQYNVALYAEEDKCLALSNARSGGVTQFTKENALTRTFAGMAGYATLMPRRSYWFRTIVSCMDQTDPACTRDADSKCAQVDVLPNQEAADGLELDMRNKAQDANDTKVDGFCTEQEVKKVTYTGASGCTTPTYEWTLKKDGAIVKSYNTASTPSVDLQADLDNVNGGNYQLELMVKCDLTVQPCFNEQANPFTISFAVNRTKTLDPSITDAKTDLKMCKGDKVSLAATDAGTCTDKGYCWSMKRTYDADCEDGSYHNDAASKDLQYLAVGTYAAKIYSYCADGLCPPVPYWKANAETRNITVYPVVESVKKAEITRTRTDVLCNNKAQAEYKLTAEAKFTDANLADCPDSQLTYDWAWTQNGKKASATGKTLNLLALGLKAQDTPYSFTVTVACSDRNLDAGHCPELPNDAQTASVDVSVNDYPNAPTITASPSPTTVCYGDDSTLTVGNNFDCSGINSSKKYYWYKNNTAFGAVDTDPTATPVSRLYSNLITTPVSLTVEAACSNSCGEAGSGKQGGNVTVITVPAQTADSISAENSTVCTDTGTVLTAQSNSDCTDGAKTYKWQSNSNGTWNDVAGGPFTVNTLSTGNLNVTTQYRFKATCIIHGCTKESADWSAAKTVTVASCTCGDANGKAYTDDQYFTSTDSNLDKRCAPGGVWGIYVTTDPTQWTWTCKYGNADPIPCYANKLACSSTGTIYRTTTAWNTRMGVRNLCTITDYAWNRDLSVKATDINMRVSNDAGQTDINKLTVWTDYGTPYGSLATGAQWSCKGDSGDSGDKTDCSANIVQCGVASSKRTLDRGADIQPVLSNILYGSYSIGEAGNTWNSVSAAQLCTNSRRAVDKSVDAVNLLNGEGKLNWQCTTDDAADYVECDARRDCGWTCQTQPGETCPTADAGRNYPTVQFARGTVSGNSMCWTAQNIKTITNPSADMYWNQALAIPDATTGVVPWTNWFKVGTRGGTKHKHGPNIPEVALGVCPTGFHVPNTTEWSNLENLMKTGTDCTSSRFQTSDCSGAANPNLPGYTDDGLTDKTGFNGSSNDSGYWVKDKPYPGDVNLYEVTAGRTVCGNFNVDSPEAHAFRSPYYYKLNSDTTVWRGADNGFCTSTGANHDDETPHQLRCVAQYSFAPSIVNPGGGGRGGTLIPPPPCIGCFRFGI